MVHVAHGHVSVVGSVKINEQLVVMPKDMASNHVCCNIDRPVPARGRVCRVMERRSRDLWFDSYFIAQKQVLYHGGSGVV